MFALHTSRVRREKSQRVRYAAGMKRAHGSPLLLALALFVTSGCTIKSLVRQIERESSKQADIVCACIPDAALEAECHDATEFGWGDCEIDALKEDSSASKETLNCMLDAMKDATKCYEDEVDCDDPLSSLSCTEEFSSADCPELPEKVQTALQECD